MSTIRTKKHGGCTYNQVAQSLKFNQTKTKNSKYQAPVDPYDVKFHRGQAGKTGPIGQSANRYQEEISKVINGYTQGQLGKNDFRAHLMNYNVNIDADLDKVIRKHESGDFQSFNEFGKRIFRQVNGTETYNRVDKINMNDTKIVSPEKKGEGHFNLATNIKKPNTRKMDDQYI